ncbi:MAG: AAA family ATPase [Candidatus Eisenbacteria bacterium]
MNRVAFQRLELQGFGPYARTTRFLLADGLSVFIAPNETGKSTFLAGLLAVLFGLPEKADPQVWGTTRFQNWEAPLPYRGSLLFLAGGQWHRIQRDFSSHQVVWTVADPSPAPPSPATDAWKALFTDEHRASGRGGARPRYEQLLRKVLGFDDLGLFRLTYCLTQDPEDRTREETIYRSRQVPADVQNLISGSGGRVSDVLARLFDAFGEITQTTGEAGLLRPGNVRAANLHTPGRLEQVEEALQETRDALDAARQALERLHGSQTLLEEKRCLLERVRVELTADRELLEKWSRWAQARRQVRDLRKGAVAVETALDQLAREEIQQREHEGTLAASLPEYQAPDFPFAERGGELQALQEAERDLERIAGESREARGQQEQIAREIELAQEEIRTRHADYVDRPHLLRDLDDWERVSAELANLQGELSGIASEIETCRTEAQRTGRWTALDDSVEPAKARPVRHLEELRSRLPRFLELTAESERLETDREACEARLAGPLRAAGEVPEELREEALVFPERVERLRLEAAAAARTAQEQQERAEALAREVAELREIETSLVEHFGPSAPPPETGSPARAASRNAELPERWNAARETIGKKLECLQEEGRLLNRMADAQRRIRAGFFRQIVLPAAGAFLAVFAVVYLATHLPPVSATPEFLAAPIAGLAIGTIVALVAYHRSKGASHRDYRAAQGRLSAVQRTLHATDARLRESGAGLDALDGEALAELEARFDRYVAIGRGMAEHKASATGADDLDRARAAAARTAAAVMDLQGRMAPLGDDPARLVSTWIETTRRLKAIQTRLREIEAEVGPGDWTRRLLAELPSIWQRLAMLARIADRAATPRQVIERLRDIRPLQWDEWIAEARSFEEASARLAELRTRADALAARDESGRSRLEQLAQRSAELQAACAPFDLDQPRDNVRISFARHQTLDEQTRNARAQLAPLLERIAALDGRARERSERIASLRGPLEDCLQPAGGDAGAAVQRLEKARGLRDGWRRAAEKRIGILKSHGVAGSDDLRIKLEELRQEAARAAEQIQALEARHAMFHDLADTDPEEIHRRQVELEQRIARATAEADTLDREFVALRDQVSEARSDGKRAGNVAVLELDLQRLETERTTLRRDREAYRLAFLTLQEAAEQFNQTHRERLQERVTEIFREISLHPRRSIRLGEDFEIEASEDGRPCAIRQLSQGARDQLALALRLAVAEMLSQEARLPLLLDDPFLAFDAARLEEMRRTLTRIAGERQVILLSHREELAGWGEAIAIE